MFSFFTKNVQKTQDEEKKANVVNTKDTVDQLDSTESCETFKFPTTTYRIPANAEMNPLMMQVMVNKDYFEELLEKRLNEKKNPQLLKITKYYSLTALELVLKHNDPKHSKVDDEKCSICLCEFFDDVDKLNINDIVEDLIPGKEDEIILLDKCEGHYYHLSCMLNYISSQSGSYIKCPICTKIYGVLLGDQPPGSMRVTVNNTMRCAGYNCGTIIIEYNFRSGNLPNGKHYHGTSRVAYLPDNKEGNEVLNLLRICFDRKLTFTVGTSVTTGRTDCVVWNGVHHKTSLTGGCSRFGYPDPTYLNRVKQELASKGIFN